MLNYGNLNDVEFEYLCQDIMQKKLGVVLRRFATGKDGGIDLCDNVSTNNIVVQVKHYANSSVSQLIASLNNEVRKVENLNPSQYYVCCSKVLSPQKVNEIYLLFSDYMDSSSNVITLNEIDDFLNNKDNIEILKKHYKLWIESTGILQNIINSETFIDCDVLLTSIQKDQKMFVQTQAYYKALDCLKNNKNLFIIGNPGVGKTITSKMLILYYAANGYKVRYTTNTSDLQALKKSISQDAKTKEIILIDDCFGQAYFQMKDSQNNELLSLIKYVNMCLNKLLILNSRVTIYQEAKERNLELVKSLDDDEYKVFIIDMNALSDVEKAKILYNHLSFNNVKKEYFEEIRKEKRYRKIINHPNYNPRLIEFICNPRHYEKIDSKHYFQFINQHLTNPKEIWKDEYERKLQKTDRILLTTIYSFSDSAIDLQTVRYSFEKRISLETDIDFTINQFEASLNRLLEGFVVMIDNNRTQKISMSNPSINDYFDGRLRENAIEKQVLIQNATHIEQIKRLTTDAEFQLWGISSLNNHTIDNYIFPDQQQKESNIVYFISENTILDSYYTKNIYNFLFNPTNIYYRGLIEISAGEIAKSLFKNNNVIIFYKVIEYLNLNDNLNIFLNSFDLDSLPELISYISKLFNDENRIKFVEASTKALELAIKDYCDYIDADNYDTDVTKAIELATSFSEYGQEVDEYDAAKYIEDEIYDEVKDEIYDKIHCIPDDIDISDDFIYNLSINICGTSYLVSSYLDDNNLEFVYHEPTEKDNDSEIDYIFDRYYE